MSSLHVSENNIPPVVITPQVIDTISTPFERIHTQEQIRDILAHEAQQHSQAYDHGWGEWS